MSEGKGLKSRMDLLMERLAKEDAEGGAVQTLTDAQRAAMSALVEKMAASPQWKEECEKRDWIQITMMGDAYKAYIESEFARIGDILKDLGLA